MCVCVKTERDLFTPFHHFCPSHTDWLFKPLRLRPGLICQSSVLDSPSPSHADGCSWRGEYPVTVRPRVIARHTHTKKPPKNTTDGSAPATAAPFFLVSPAVHQTFNQAARPARETSSPRPISQGVRQPAGTKAPRYSRQSAGESAAHTICLVYTCPMRYAGFKLCP